MSGEDRSRPGTPRVEAPASPACSIETAVVVGRPLDEHQWLDAHPCPCGGEWEMQMQVLIGREENEIGHRMTDRLDVRCSACGSDAQFFFVVQYTFHT